MGKTGAGKSSVGNTIFQESVFKVFTSAKSGTTKCQTFTKELNGKSIKWIDTPGFFDTNRPEEEMKLEIVKCITECAPGPHVFLIMLKTEKFTKHEQEVVNKLNDYFSEEVLKFAIVLFSHGDQLDEEQKIEDFVHQNEGLRELVEKCGNRCHVIDNKYWNNNQHEYRNNQYQVSELLQTMDNMIEANNGGYYTNNFLQQKAQKIMAMAYSCTVGALMCAFLGHAVLT